MQLPSRPPADLPESSFASNGSCKPRQTLVSRARKAATASPCDGWATTAEV